MKIESVTPARPYRVLTPDGDVLFGPGDVLQVTGLRFSGSIEFLSVMGKGIRFDIPSPATTVLTELALT